MRAARVRVVGTAFLRWRPLIVAPVIAGQAVLLATTNVPIAQRLSLTVAMALLLGLFVVEALRVRSRIVTEAWLFVSLAVTALGITAAMVVSGGTASPLLVIVLAPLVIAFAAFGRRPKTLLLLAAVVVVVVAIAIVGAFDRLPWPPLPEATLGWMRLLAFVGTVALAWTGVARLADAYAEAARQLEVSRIEALTEASNRLRSLALVSAKVAHDIKNPLTAIKALIQLEHHERDVDDPSARRFVVVLGEIERLDLLVREHLAFARLESAETPSISHFDAHALLEEVAVLLSAQAETRAVTLTCVRPQQEAMESTIVPPAIGPSAIVTPAIPVVGDRTRLREALFNLADNAVQASPPGAQVELACAVFACDSKGGGRLRWTVSDRGGGLDVAIASAFEAGDCAYMTTRAGGTGLGLTLARAAADLHGGTLVLEKRVGGGTVAILDLPATAPPAEPEGHNAKTLSLTNTALSDLAIP